MFSTLWVEETEGGWFNLCEVCSSARLVGACSVYSSSQVGTKEVNGRAHSLDSNSSLPVLSIHPMVKAFTGPSAVLS